MVIIYNKGGDNSTFRKTDKMKICCVIFNPKAYEKRSSNTLKMFKKELE